MADHEFDSFIEEIAGELRRPVRFDSSFESRVIAALDPSLTPMEHAHERRKPWILRPRPFYVSPLAGLAVAAGLVAIITMSVWRTQPSREIAGAANAPAVTTASAPLIPVAFEPNGTAAAAYAAPFTYIDSHATSVAVVGSFNNWDTTKHVLTRSSDSVWTTTILLPPARYEYQFVVDGQWIADPGAQKSAPSDFGGTNSVLVVSPVPR